MAEGREGAGRLIVDVPAHYAVKQLRSMEEVRANFPESVVYSLNWLFLSTSGVHGTYRTLDDIERCYGGCCDCDPEDDVPGEPHLPPRVTVLVVHPRRVEMLWGHIAIEPEDIPWLRNVVARTLEAVHESQDGNLP